MDREKVEKIVRQAMLRHHTRPPFPPYVVDAVDAILAIQQSEPNAGAPSPPSVGREAHTGSRGSDKRAPAPCERYKALEAALRPFAQIYALNVPLPGKPDFPDIDFASDHIPDTATQWGDFRRAAEALAATRGGAK